MAQRTPLPLLAGSPEPPPADLDAEQRVLGALLLAGSLAASGEDDGTAAAISARVLALLAPADFARAWHQRVYAALQTAHRAGSWGYQAVAHQLAQSHRAGNPVAHAQEQADLVGLLNAPVNWTFMREDAGAVLDCALRRALLGFAGEVAALAYERPGAEAVRAATERLTRLAHRVPRPRQAAGVLDLR